jgi:hypothetical protein
MPAVPPYSEIVRMLFDPSKPWILIPNGSLGGFFDFVPVNLRVGPWFVLSLPFLILFASAVLYTKPPLAFPATVFPELHSWPHLLSLLASANGFMVLARIMKVTGPGVACTYTITSWIILTLHVTLYGLLTYCDASPASASTLVTSLVWFYEALRFPSLVAASVTFTIWNFILAPIMYTFFMKTPEKKAAFLSFNFTFNMTEIHVLNYPIAVFATVLSPAARPLEFVDLWCSLAVALYYSLLYLCILDRIGVHLYPVFSPRSKVSVLTWLSVFFIYYFTYSFWNSIIGDLAVQHTVQAAQQSTQQQVVTAQVVFEMWWNATRGSVGDVWALLSGHGLR